MLKTKYSNLGLSDQVLGAMADQILAGLETGATADQIQTAVDGVDGTLKLIQGEADRVRKATKAEKESTEKKKSGADSGNDDPEKEKSTGDVPDWAKALIDSNKELKEKLSSFEQGKTTETRKQELSKLTEGLPEKVKLQIEKDFNRMTFKDDADYQEWKTEKETDYEEIRQETKVEAGANFGRPIVPKGTNVEKASTSMQNFLKEKESQSKDGGVAVGKSPFE